MGVDVTMPRAPAVYDPKLKWKLDDVDLHPEAEVESYVSAKGFESQLQEAFEKEAEIGWMREITDDDAKRIYGDRLAVAALKVVKEKTKFRVAHDGTHGVAVNNRIRVRDQARSPTAGEIKTLMREKQRLHGGARRFVFVGDIASAHRRVKVRPEDWGLQACRLGPGTVFG